MLMTYKPKYRGRHWLRYCAGSCYTVSGIMEVIVLPYSWKEIKTQYQPSKTQDSNFRSFSTTLSTVYRQLMTSCVCLCVFAHIGIRVYAIFLLHRNILEERI